MPAVEVQSQAPPEPNEQPAAPETKKPTVGIIYPPPEVRNIVDKTASFVARNGPEFESRIRQNEINNPKFNFLNPNDPYHAYYQHKVTDIKEGKVQESMIPKVTNLSQLQTPKVSQPQVVQETIVPKEPPAEFEFVADPPSISAYDLDIVKLTAQFVARNGRQFLTNLMNKEQRNYQFDFLRPQHSLFNYFTKLVEQYTKVLIPPKNLMSKLKKEGDNPREIMNQVKYRVEWEKFQERERKREEDERERERVAFLQIDWHDFVVVETVDFQPHEIANLPPPTTPDQLGARILIQERMEKGHTVEPSEVEMEVEDMDEASSEDEDEGPTLPGTADTTEQDMDEGDSDVDEDAPTPPPQPPPEEALPQPPPLPPQPEEVQIRRDYDPKAARIQPPTIQDTTAWVVSPITGERIPVDKLQEHMRISLLDPRWVEEKQSSLKEKQSQEEVFAPGSAIDSSLKMLAERRTDIFGAGDEETRIGRKLGEEEKKTTKVTWDGHTASMEATTRAAQKNITLQEQIEAIHKAKGLTADEEKEKIGPAIPAQTTVELTPTTSTIPAKPPVPLPTPQSTTIAHTPIAIPIPAPPKPPMPPQMLQQLRPHVNLIPRPPMPPQPPMLIARPPMVPPPMAQMARAAGFAFPPGTMPTQPPRPPMSMPQFVPAPPPVPAPPRPIIPERPPATEEPAAKKQKTEDTLVSEEEFLKRNKGPVTFKVIVPKMDDKSEWNLNGQTLTFTLPVTDTVSVIKAKIHEALAMPAGKQKLQYEGIFIKDSNTLAFYNMTHGATIQLALKERGGRKK
ncbi:splicing factor 3A subunit 1-like [Branchiostoma floridae x Branchiostoma belcheri]